MTAIKELMSFINNQLQYYHYPKHHYREWDLLFEIKSKLKELAKRDLEDYQNKIKYKETILTRLLIGDLGADYFKDLEDIASEKESSTKLSKSPVLWDCTKKGLPSEKVGDK